ncbi:hypothetical protein [Psychrobacillus sp.]|uniref:anti-sigma factor domain-containing protein n=1 Tax=Psychrobacillus sp. TaxID=1871623 RepID=UPI0028BDF762|nr:hypothetical protein [Psychrobacillus sp.]
MKRTYRGIVCEKNNDHMIFLSKEGEFLRGIPLVTDPGVGEEVEFHLAPTINLRRKRMKPFFIGPSLIAAVLLIFFIASLISQTNSAFAYVQIEGEMAFEFGVDEEGNVMSLRSIDDASAIELGDWEGLSFGTVLANTVNQIAPRNSELVITTVYEKQEQAEFKKRIDQAVNEVTNAHADKTWSIQESTVKEREEANKNNKSIQKFKNKVKEPKIEEKQRENPTSKNQPEKQKIPEQSNKKEKNISIPNNNKEKSTPANKPPNNSKEKQQENNDQDRSLNLQDKSKYGNNANSNNNGNIKNNGNSGNNENNNGKKPNK